MADDLIEEITSKIPEDESKRLSVRAILELVAEKQRNRIESVRLPPAALEEGMDVYAAENEERDLVTPDNAQIPGGRPSTNDPGGEPAKYVYDPKSKSVRKHFEF